MDITPPRQISTASERIKSPYSGTPTKDIQERLKMIITNLQNNQNNWETAHKRGLNLCKFIESIKIKSMGPGNHQRNDDNNLYPEAMLNPCEKLKEIESIFDEILLKAINTEKSIVNLAKLCDKNSNEIFYRTWKIENFIKFTKIVTQLYKDDLKVKKNIIENIAHSQNKFELILQTSAWEYSVAVNDDQKLLFKFLALEIEKK